MNLSTIEVKGNVLFKRSFVVGGNVLIAHGGRLIDQYTGEYTVIPRTYEQTLDTDNKYLTNDVTVTQIPKTVVDNLFNGQTVTIG